jgi:hypothetical protein
LKKDCRSRIRDEGGNNFTALTSHNTASTDASSLDIEVSFPAVSAATGNLFKDSEVLLDNQSSINLFGNAGLLTQIQACERTSTTGVGGSVIDAHAKGLFYGMEVFHSPACIANILSFAAAKDQGLRVVFDEEKDRFAIYLPSRDMTLFFVRRDEQRHYVHDTCNPREMAAGMQLHTTNLLLVTTVKDRELLYSKREIRDMKKAMELVRIMGLPSVKDLIKMLNSGAIMNTDVTGRALSNAINVYGPDVRSLAKGQDYEESFTTSGSRRTPRQWRDASGSRRYHSMHRYLFYQRNPFSLEH